MKAEVVSMTADNLDMEAIRRGGDILKQGGLVAFPTETVYGLSLIHIYSMDPEAAGKRSGQLLVPGCDPLYWIQSGCAGQDDP